MHSEAFTRGHATEIGNPRQKRRLTMSDVFKNEQKTTKEDNPTDQTWPSYAVTQTKSEDDTHKKSAPLPISDWASI